MLRSRPLPLLAAATLLLASGCSSTGSASRGGHPSSARPIAASAGATDNGHTITLAVGARLTVTLRSTYWVFQPSSQPEVLRGSAPNAHPDPTGQIPGSGNGTVGEVFTAVRTGTASVSARRVSCGEARRCLPGQDSYRLTVVVH